MAKIKNISFEPIEAVLSDDSVIRMEPLQIYDVPDRNVAATGGSTWTEVDRLTKERHPGKLVEVGEETVGPKESVETKKVPVETAVPAAVEMVVPHLSEVQGEHVCKECGKVAKSKLGLISHMRKHK